MKKIRIHIPLCVFFLLAMLFLSSCQSGIRFASRVKAPLPDQGSSGVPANAQQEKLLRAAESWLGTPYCYGGNSKNCTDCSGFVSQVYQSSGIKIPRTSNDQFINGKEISVSELEIGDLVFFSLESGKTVSHVGIYVGNSQFIHASSSRGVVRQSLYELPFSSAVAGYRRMVKGS